MFRDMEERLNDISRRVDLVSASRESVVLRLKELHEQLEQHEKAEAHLANECPARKELDVIKAQLAEIRAELARLRTKNGFKGE